MAEYNIWEKKEDLENVKEVMAEFEEKLSVEVRKQEKLDLMKE